MDTVGWRLRCPPACVDPETPYKWLEARARSAISSSAARDSRDTEAHRILTGATGRWRRPIRRDERLIRCASQISGSTASTKPVRPRPCCRGKCKQAEIRPHVPYYGPRLNKFACHAEQVRIDSRQARPVAETSLGSHIKRQTLEFGGKTTSQNYSPTQLFSQIS